MRSLWYNYQQDGKHRWWRWHADESLRYFFVAPRWGVSAAWLRQMSARILFQYSSFEGVAKVHAHTARATGDPELAAGCAPRWLLEAWMKWRVVIRAYEHEAASTEPVLTKLDLQMPLDVLVPNAAISGKIGY